jgi:hypothetical protein
MAVLGDELQTLADLTSRLDPDGKIASIGEWLSLTNEFNNMLMWKEGNLPTGERTTVRVGLPSVAYRGYNQGTDKSKSRTAQIDEGAALLEGKSAVDRELAKASGNVANYRLTESSAFFEAMSQQAETTCFYGNAATSPKEFTGLAPRYNSLSGSTSDQIIAGGGAGTDNSSIWLVVTGPMGVCGIYPQNTKAGLSHIDVTSGTGVADDGVDIGAYETDADGKEFLALKDQYNWHMGLSVKDYRKAVRICNIDKSLLISDYSTGAQIQMLMVDALERIEGLNMPGHTAAFIMPRNIRSMLRQQLLTDKNAFLSYEDVAGRKVMHFGEVPVLRSDALRADEALVS